MVSLTKKRNSPADSPKTAKRTGDSTFNVTALNYGTVLTMVQEMQLIDASFKAQLRALC